MKEREKLLLEFSRAAFYAFDVALFLDTHPFHSDALACHHHYAAKAAALRRDYESRFGPLTVSAAGEPHCWDWTEGPWPWEA